MDYNPTVHFFREMGLSGLPEDYNFEIQAREVENEDLIGDFYGGENSNQTPEKFVIEQINKLNTEQKAAFNRISAAVLGLDKQKLFFIDGGGGCGIILLCLHFHLT